MDQLGHYILALLDHWLFTFGGIVLVVFALWEKAKNKTTPSRLYWTLAVLCLFYATFQAWQGEYIKTHPGIKLEITMAGSATSNKPNHSRVVFSVAVSNTGPPSIADNWELEVKFPSGRDETFGPDYLDPNKTLDFQMANGQQMHLSGDDILYNKTMKGPLTTGMKEVGLIAFTIDVPVDEIKKGTKFMLKCKDIDGHPVAVEHTFTGAFSGSLRFIPGTHPVDSN